jgi:KaiC/GvpD/RAD55 family RecA-like ATPase
MLRGSHRLSGSARARQSLVRQLASCRCVEEHQNLLVVGATGTGKTFVGCAFAHQACRKGFRALYRRASRLFHELTLARAEKPDRLASLRSGHDRPIDAFTMERSRCSRSSEYAVWSLGRPRQDG